MPCKTMVSFLVVGFMLLAAPLPVYGSPGGEKAVQAFNCYNLFMETDAGRTNCLSPARRL